MWQDKEVRFDIPNTQMQPRLGEFTIDKLNSIEDTKGNAGDKGRFIVTNLRIIWHSSLLPRINLSIGYNTFLMVNSKSVQNLHGKEMQVLHILASYQNSQYEFMFTNHDTRSTRHYTSVIGVYSAYTSSRIYREIKLRSGIVTDKQLTLLPQEIVHSTLQDVWNLSVEQGNIGIFIVTNIRLVWFADMNYQFNISIPYLTITNITIKNSKFGPTLVIATAELSDGCTLGFRVNPLERLNVLYKEILTSLKTFEKSPIFGVDYTLEHQTVIQEELKEEKYLEMRENENQTELLSPFGYYSSDGTNQARPGFSTYFGLAAEEPCEGVTLKNLWDLVPQN